MLGVKRRKTGGGGQAVLGGGGDKYSAARLLGRSYSPGRLPSCVSSSCQKADGM